MTKTESRPLICSHCGHTGEDVIKQLTYVGGKGYVLNIECQDSFACWKRWDKQHPLIKEKVV